MPSTLSADTHRAITPPGAEPGYRRGDIVFVDHPASRSVGTEIWARKFAVVVSTDKLNARSGFAVIVYLSTSPNKRPSKVHVPVMLPSGAAAMALCEQVHTVDASRVSPPAGRIPDAVMDQIAAATCWTLDLEG